MGYTTDFNGTLKFNKEVTEELKNFINNFSNSRRMERNNEKIKEVFPDWENQCYKGNLGREGEYFIGGNGFKGQGEDQSIINFNYPPITQPGLWCQWIINDNGELEWDGGEKFYCYVEWLEYLIENFFDPEGYILNGIIGYQGESFDDYGDIVVIDNDVTVNEGTHAMDLGKLTDNELINELEKRGYKIS